jgi:uncharacterized protein
MPKKTKNLKKILKSMKSVVLAFSGGVDSTFLLKIAIDALGRNNVLAVTARSETFPRREYYSAKAIARQLAANFLTIYTEETKNKSFLKNPVDRCYYCKKELFERLLTIAKKSGIDFVIDGTNFDDRKDLRYGSRAAKKLGIRSPLAEAHIGKADIRRFSKQVGLPTWDKPSFACLASRFPYHHGITKEKLIRIDRAEEFLYKCRFRQVRVRAHNDIARIEVERKDIKKILLNQRLQKNIANRLKKLGFSYVTLDLEGYRTGSMNEVLSESGGKIKRLSGSPA